MRRFAAVFTFLLALDQLVKWWAREEAQWVEGNSIWAVWPNVFELKLTYNYGIAFGLFQGGGVLFAPVAILISGYAVWWLHRHPHASPGMQITLGALAAGAMGNLIDRLWLGKVTDMFWFRAINFPVFNVADACITCSAVALFLLSVRGDSRAKSQASEPAPHDPA